MERAKLVGGKKTEPTETKHRRTPGNLGEDHSVQKFLEKVFAYLKLDWKKHLEVDERFFRPAEVDRLIGDAGKARQVLGWRPHVNFRRLPP